MRQRRGHSTSKVQKVVLAQRGQVFYPIRMPGVALLIFSAVDSAGNRIGKHLAAHGWEVETCATTTAALLRLVRPPRGTKPVDLLIMAAGMPGMSPDRLIKAARSSPGCAQLALITVGTDPLQLDRAQAIPVDDLAALDRALARCASPAVHAADGDLLDAETVRMLQEVPGLWERARATQIQELPAHLAALEQAITSGDLAGVHRIGHALKGSLGSLGCRELQLVLGRMDAAAQSGDLAQVESLGPGIRPLADRTIAALQRY